MDNSTIILIADYGSGDPSFTEVTLQLKTLIPGATILPQSTPPFSTINTGFWIYQFGMTPNLKNTSIYSNTAPRREDKGAQANNRGEKLMYAKLKNGLEVIAVNAGYCFSFIKPFITEFAFVNTANEGSQFRSRDIFPKAVAKILEKDSSFIGEIADISLIPDYPKDHIAHIDGYGNIKTTTRLSDLSYNPGQKLIIELNGKRQEGYFTDGSFNVAMGQLAFSPGSSGHDDKFMEIFYRGASASSLFGGLNVEQPFTTSPL